MNTTTDLANYALAHLGEPQITDIDGENNTARLCKRFVSDTIDEVIRSHRWNCATARATLTRLSEAPAHGLTYAYQLPAGFLRLLEVNGEAWEGTDEFFEIEEDKELRTDVSTVKIRYLKRIGVSDMDPLLAEAVAFKLASKLAVPITAKLDQQTQMLGLYDRALRKASAVDAVETKTKEGREMERIISNSPLVRSRFRGRYTQTRFYNKFPTW